MALYNDLVSILLGFFVLLFSASAIDRRKYEQLSASLAESMGGGSPQLAGNKEAGFDFNEVLRLLVKHVEQSRLSEHITLTRTLRGIELSTDSELMFDSGQADLRPDAQRFLSDLAGLLRGVVSNVIVEGHTDGLPISSRQYPSNWELSSARASSVVRFLIAAGIEPDRLMAVGRADTRPSLPLRPEVQTRRQRQRDRRVILVLTPRSQEDMLQATGRAAEALKTGSGPDPRVDAPGPPGANPPPKGRPPSKTAPAGPP